MLANFGERYGTARILTMIAGGVIAGLALLVGLLGCVINLVAFSAGTVTRSQFTQAEQTLAPFALAGLVGLLFIWRAPRRALARMLPISPDSPVSYLTIVLGLLLIAQQIGTQLVQQVPLTYGELLAQDIPFLVLAFVGVGIFIRRSPAETFDRLALRPPASRRWWLISILGIGAFLAIAFGIETVANLVAPDQQKKVTDVSNVLFSHFNNPGAIVFLGILAGVVEETLFRGALLPRFGVLLSSILFAALHTQYAVSFATLEVFVLGLGLGWLRVQSKSILPCMVTHAGYDIAVGLIPFLFK